MPVQSNRAESWVDISMILDHEMGVWPGDPNVEITPVRQIRNGAPYNLSSISMSLHSGTHLDAPRHFIETGLSVDRAPLDLLIGPAQVIELTGGEPVTPLMFQKCRIGACKRLILKTNTVGLPAAGKFNRDYRYITPEAGQYLVEKEIGLVGIDSPSIGPIEPDAYDVHRSLLDAGIWILEGLDLSMITPGMYDLICLPMKIRDGDGAPARVVLRRR
ncbi:cyclase family protein [Dehalogenimonas alkenigignens]|uniref:Kynurenine formamidase n=1 Tax=Dehalogenimonas alkenigignens TaxID=1217799 RepID=A0A0W0GJS2_9CHLR|nr:cyclase family protein [Dehalogenimonas alkenigignens]KTB48801.1 Kynurenine formamidase [Dehalogenimonas alkenigignens]PVV84789.1 cyclase family protein [Dehalogenimonas alkenigignens]